jgi:hypothetical protein
MTRTTRSRFDHDVGGTVEGCTILEKRIVIPPDPAERRRGVYEYLVEVPPTTSTPRPAASTPRPAATKPDTPRKLIPKRESFTRATPDERGVVVRRVPPR